MSDIFISYKAEEINEAKWVRQQLEANGYSCWMAPDSISGGASYAVEIPRAINEAKIFLLVLSSKSQASPWVSKEVSMGITAQKWVLPFMIENCELRDDFAFYLADVQRYSAFDNKNAAMNKMLKDITDSGLVISKDLDDEDEEDFGGGESHEGDKDHGGSNDKPIKPKYDVMCILSLALYMFNFFGIFSIIGLKNITKNGKRGKGLAIAGLIISIILCFGVCMGGLWMPPFFSLVVTLIYALLIFILFKIFAKEVSFKKNK